MAEGIGGAPSNEVLLMKPVFVLRPSAPAWQVIGEVFSLFASDERLDYAAYGRFIDFKKTVMCATALHACLTRTHPRTHACARTHRRMVLSAGQKRTLVRCNR
jgi:hypothetical protein